MNPHSLIHATNRNPAGSEPPVKVRRSFSWRIKPYGQRVSNIERYTRWIFTNLHTAIQ